MSPPESGGGPGPVPPARPAAEKPLRIPDGPRHQPYPFSELHPTDLLGAFFLCGLAFLAVAAIAALVDAAAPWNHGRWLALHLAFFGGVSQLILGATQFFAGAFLATDPPSRRLVRTQLGFWNGGTILLAVAVPADLAAPVWIAVAALTVGLGAWVRGLASIRRRSLNRNPWATRWYEAAGVFFIAGIVAGTLLATGNVWAHGYLTGAHMALNLGGWFGAAIVGTLHTFYPTLTRTRLRFPRLQPPAFLLWTIGIGALAIGYGFALEPLVQAGWAGLAASSALLLANIVACRMASSTELSLAARAVGAAQLFLPAALVVLAAGSFTDGSVFSPAGRMRAAAGILLIAGWVGLTVAGSLIHLLFTLLRARDHRRPRPRKQPVADPAVVALTVAGISGLAICRLAGADGVAPVFGLAMLAGYLVLAVRIALLGFGVLREARPSL